MAEFFNSTIQRVRHLQMRAMVMVVSYSGFGGIASRRRRAAMVLSRLAPPARLVTPRQTFVLRCHAWQRLRDEQWFGEQIQLDARPIGMGAGGALSRREGGRMGNLLFWLGIGAAQKGAGSKPIKRRHWVASLVVGILIAVLIAVGMFFLLVSQQ
jgi:hypothetical protein